MRNNYYAILGVPLGASIDHIKASYCLLARKSALTELAYRTLTDPATRMQYDAVWTQVLKKPEQSEPEQDWGVRGREKCSCGKILELDEDWYCGECGWKLEYLVMFDMFGGHVIHDSQIPLVTGDDGESYWQTPANCSIYGPFTKEEAEEVLREKNELRRRL